jgi:hypothetical protein
MKEPGKRERWAVVGLLLWTGVIVAAVYLAASFFLGR